MGREDQQEEREVLDSIFPDEITDIDETSYRVAVKLDIPDADEESPPTLCLTVSYPEAYPDVGPHLDITLPPNAPRIPSIDLSTDRTPLLTSLETTVEENLGMAMVFALVSALKENAEALVNERHEAAARELEKVAEAAEAKENEKFHGTPVTAATFVEWRARFVKEMAEKAERAREEKEAEDRKRRGGGGGGGGAGGAGGAGESDKLTGRQLWERGLAGKAGEEDYEVDGGEDKLSGKTLV